MVITWVVFDDAPRLSEGMELSLVLHVRTRFPMLKLSILLLAASLGSRLLAASTPDYVPMKVIQTEPVVVPQRAADLGITTGEVRVAVQVDQDGKLTDYLVTAYTHPSLANSAVQALKKWKYEPAWIAGHPRSAMVDLVFVFESRGLVVVDMSIANTMDVLALNLRPSANSYRAVAMRQLDRIPTPTKVVQPAYAASSVSAPVRVTVHFYIDEKGQVRLPAVSREINEAHEALAAAAIEAVSQWTFEPPMSNGRPVLVAARQDFNFGGKP